MSDRGLSVAEIRALLRNYGGRIHGPNVETVSIAETDFYKFLAEFQRECERGTSAKIEKTRCTPPKRPTKQAIDAALTYLRAAVDDERFYASNTDSEDFAKTSGEIADRLASVVAWLEAEREG